MILIRYQGGHHQRAERQGGQQWKKREDNIKQGERHKRQEENKGQHGGQHGRQHGG